MTKGTAAGLLTTIGVSAGLGLYATLSLLGLSAILVEYHWLAWAIRIAGGCYLIYLGFVLIRSKPQQVELAENGKATRNPLLFGFFVTLTNPKAIVLFASVFATAVIPRGTITWVLDELDIVGIFPNYAEAYKAWKAVAQKTVDNAQVRYFIVHIHRLLDPGTSPPPRT
jgi:threonine/homoserine/homoserine lactone efflux protein